jgi:Mn2+/Fe2+ NRAMP family transporter
MIEMAKKRDSAPKAGTSKLLRFWRILGPGLVTGASDDDPSGIATYSQAGAAYGLSTLWTARMTFPLMASIQEFKTCFVFDAVVQFSRHRDEHRRRHCRDGSRGEYISNNKKIMGKYTNGKTSNILGFAALVLMTVAAVILVCMQLM